MVYKLLSRSCILTLSTFLPLIISVSRRLLMQQLTNILSRFCKDTNRDYMIYKYVAIKEKTRSHAVDERCYNYILIATFQISSF